MSNFRKITSLTALWSFILLILTSVILYIVPAGRVAYWADWRLWGLSKTQWGELHINLGVLFLAAIGLHLYLNWRPVVAYMKNNRKQLTIFNKNFNIALAVTAVVMLGTYLRLPPFSTIINAGNTIKDVAAEKYGEPPYGHAELSSLKTLSDRMGWDFGQSLERLKKSGYTVDDPRQSVLEVAAKHRVSPRQVFLAMQPVETKAATLSSGLPDSPPPGIGRRALTEVAQAYNLDLPLLLRGLNAEKVNAAAEQTLKEIADQHQMAPRDLYDVIKRVAGQPQTGL